MTRKRTQKEQLADIELALTKTVLAMTKMNKTLTNHMTDYQKSVDRINLKVNLGIAVATMLGTAWFGISAAVVVKFLVG